MDDMETRIADLTSSIRDLARTREEANPSAKAADGGRYASALDGSKEIADKLAELDTLKADMAAAKAKADTREMIQDVVREVLGTTRQASKAAAIGQGQPLTAAQTRRVESAVVDAFPTMKAAFQDYRSGEFLTALLDVKNLGDGIDVDRANAGKAALMSLGAWYGNVPEKSASYGFVAGDGKATLGATGATGGYVLPNNLVDTLIKPGVQRAVLQNLVTVINGVAVRGVDQPFRTGRPARAEFQDWGTTKENVNEAYGSYTATLGTIARIYDIGKQYARFSAGAAERDVMDELSKGVILGENYYMVAGAGTGSVGSGDPTTGIYTALNARPGFKAAFAAASASTVAGSFAAACATMLKNLSSNFTEPTAFLVDNTTYFSAIAQGSDTAGFWVDPAGGPTGFARNASGQLTYWGIPVFYDVNLGTNATTKILIGADFARFKLFRGMEFRIDSTDLAGDRWDKNLIGFRGEEEIGFNASSAVETGAAFLLTSVIP